MYDSSKWYLDIDLLLKSTNLQSILYIGTKTWYNIYYKNLKNF